MNFSLCVLSRSILALSVYTAAAFCSASDSPSKMLAPTPPMGWNSWDSFGPTVREDEVKSNADAMAAKLAKFGWQYIVVDIE
jgi:alpha-galactosidase